jgi:D-glucuronyl C5-epimerase C-terminus
VRGCMEIVLQREPRRNFEPSIGVMGVMRTSWYACLALLAALAVAAPASADEVLVLGKDGRVRERDDRFLRSTDLPRPRSRAPLAATAARGRKKGPTVIAELRRLRDGGLITPEDYAARRATYVDVKRRARGFSGLRATQMRAVIATVDEIAASRQLIPSRLAPLWLTLERNLEWWSSGPLLASGRRVEFEGSELVWQYYPGQGLQLQVLGNFGKLNGLWGGRQNGRLALMLDELLPLAAERAGGLAWEYYFAFGGGRPPWVSGLAQGTAVQALARAAARLRRQADVLPVAQRALAVFEAPTPQGVRVPAEAGDHYAIYSFAPGLRVLNGFIQALNGLHDYARLSGDPRGTALFQAAEPQARREVPTYDTGAWSLYSRGSSSRESDLGYHDLLTEFLEGLCRRTDQEVYCTTAANFVTYKSQPPVLEVEPRRLRGGKPGRVAFELSKISTLSLRILRGSKVVEARPFGVIGHGRRTFGWDVPRRRGDYTVELAARDLVGNTAVARAVVEVLKPKRKTRP